MIDIINLFISLAIPFGIGFFILSLVFRDYYHFWTIMALSYGIGFGVIAYVMLILGIMNLPLNAFVLPKYFQAFLVLLALLYMLFHQVRKTQERKNKEAVHSQDAAPGKFKACLTTVFIIFIASQLFFVFNQSLSNPIETWDAVATCSLKAKIFFYDQSPFELKLPHAAYPLFTPLIEAWISFHLGHWDDQLVKIIVPLAFTSYLILHYGFLRSFTNRFWAISGIGLLVSSAFFVFHATLGYRDIIMTYFNCTTLLLILSWSREKHQNLLILSAIFSGLTSFAKLEGSIYILIHIALLAVVLLDAKTYSTSFRLKSFFTFTLITIGICSIFFVCKSYLGIGMMSGRLHMVAESNIFEKLIQIICAYTKTLFAGGNWNLLWIILIISTPGGILKASQIKEIKYLYLTLIAFFMMYTLFFLFTKSLIDYPTTLSRVILHFYPICPMLIILIHAPMNRVSENI